MQRIIKTLRLLVAQSWITLGTIVLMMLVFFGMIFIMSDGEQSSDKLLQVSSTMNYVVSGMAGVYLGGGVLRLKTSYLWGFLPAYRTNLIISLLCATTVLTSIQFFLLFLSGWPWTYSLVSPFCVVMLSTNFVLGRNLFMKIILPTFPFILIHVFSITLSNNLLISMLIILTVISLFVLFNDRHFSGKFEASMFSVSTNYQQYLNSAVFRKTNEITIRLISLFYNPVRSRDLSVALLTPVNRFGIEALGYALVVFVILQMDDTNKFPLNEFCLLLISTSMLSLFMEFGAKARQIKSIAHLYSSVQPPTLKHSISRSLDIQIVFHVSRLLVIFAIFAAFTQTSLNAFLLLRAAVTIGLIAMAFQPVLLCLDWFNVNFKLVFAITIYFALILLFTQWHYNNNLMQLLSMESGLGILLLVAIRVISNRIWKEQPIEQFMRIYG